MAQRTTVSIEVQTDIPGWKFLLTNDGGFTYGFLVNGDKKVRITGELRSWINDQVNKVEHNSLLDGGRR